MNNKICILLLCLCLTGCAGEQKMKNQVPQHSETPVSENNISEDKTNDRIVSEKEKIVPVKRFDENELYDYDKMEADLKEITYLYSDMAKLNVTGKTVDGRNIYEVLIGKESSEKHVVIHGSIHAREYITTRLVMKQTEDFLKKCFEKEKFGNKTYDQLLEGVALHIIPMVNPDGVAISQYGPQAIRNAELKSEIYDMVSEGYDFTKWKANARGVDLNRNFDADWETYNGADAPSPERYKGEVPGSEEETKALLYVTENYPVVRTISYHTYGQVIYWYFKQQGDFKNKSERFAEIISETTGYPIDSNYEQLDPAGYKDWAIDKKFIPSLTVEIGHSQNPVPFEQFENIWNQNKDVWAVTLSDLSDEEYHKYEQAQVTLQQGAKLTVINCDEWISLREEPTADSNRILEIPKGDKVTFISESENGFYAVEYNGHTGFADSYYLK